ncbi:MAG: NADH-quinone oxidoreductase subunit A [Bacteroidia bacterium]|nr:NADH-quinone oxidoreductase subunit A [Bacteroidia bacterium]
MTFLIAENGVQTYLPILFMFIAAMGFIVTSMLATHYLGPKRKSKIKDEAFECGIESQGNARTPFSIKYFLVAILFVLFDVEVIFMYPWAVNFKNLGVLGLIEMFMFMGFLVLGLLYIIKKGALKWE